MAFDVVEIPVTTVAGEHVEGDVFFNLTSFKIPARSCKLVNMYLQIKRSSASDDTKVDDVKLGILFFQKNTQPTLGTLDDTANISAADFTSNQYIGQQFLFCDEGSGFMDENLIDEMMFLYPCSAYTQIGAQVRRGGIFDEMVLKGDAGSTTLYCAGVVHQDVNSSGAANAPDFNGTDNVKLILQLEY